MEHILSSPRLVIGLILLVMLGFSLGFVLCIMLTMSKNDMEHADEVQNEGQLMHDILQMVAKWRRIARNELDPNSDDDEDLPDSTLASFRPHTVARLIDRIEDRCKRVENHTPVVPTNG